MKKFNFCIFPLFMESKKFSGTFSCCFRHQVFITHQMQKVYARKIEVKEKDFISVVKWIKSWIEHYFLFWCNQLLNKGWFQSMDYFKRVLRTQKHWNCWKEKQLEAACEMKIVHNEREKQKLNWTMDAVWCFYSIANKKHTKFVMKIDKLQSTQTEKKYSTETWNWKSLWTWLKIATWSEFLLLLFYSYPRHRFSDRVFHAGSICSGAFHFDLITIERRTREGKLGKSFSISFEAQLFLRCSVCTHNLMNVFCIFIFKWTFLAFRVGKSGWVDFALMINQWNIIETSVYH